MNAYSLQIQPVSLNGFCFTFNNYCSPPTTKEKGLSES